MIIQFYFDKYTAEIKDLNVFIAACNNYVDDNISADELVRFLIIPKSQILHATFIIQAVFNRNGFFNYYFDDNLQTYFMKSKLEFFKDAEPIQIFKVIG